MQVHIPKGKGRCWEFFLGNCRSLHSHSTMCELWTFSGHSTIDECFKDLFTGQMPFLPPNQQSQNTEGTQQSNADEWWYLRNLVWDFCLSIATEVGQLSWLVKLWLVLSSDYKGSRDGACCPINIHMEHCTWFPDDIARVLAVSRQVSILLAPPGCWHRH